MQLILEVHEAWSLMMLVASQVVDGVELSEDGKDAVRTWRSDHGDATEKMAALADEMNEALGNVVDERTRKIIRRKGRYISSVDRR